MKHLFFSLTMTLFLLQPSITGLNSLLYGQEFIDTHVHLRNIRNGELQGMMQSLPKNRSRPSRPPIMKDKGKQTFDRQNRDNAADHLLSRMDQMGVSKALVVVVPADHTGHEKEYTDMRNLVHDNPHNLLLLAGGAQLSDLLHKTVPSQVTDADKKRFRTIAQKILSEGAVGFGEMISYHLCMAEHHSFKYAAPDHPLFLLLSDIAAENNVPIDLHMEAIEYDRPMPENLRIACSQNPKTLTATIPGLENLLAHNRKTRIVWQHIGWDNTGEMKPSLLRHLLENNPNLYLGLRVEKREDQVGNGGPMPNRIIDRARRIKPEWLQLISDFPDRFVLGSDEFFFARSTERPNQSFVETFSILEQLDTKLARLIGCDNALLIYGIDKDQ